MTLFHQISDYQPSIEGWCTPEKASTLAAAVVALHARLSVEIGVFGGSSFIPIALAHKHLGLGVAWGIDPWSKHAGVAAQTEDPSRKWWAELDYEAVYGRFHGHLDKLGLQQWVKIIRKPSQEVTPPPDIDFLHVDGAHNDQAVEDVRRFAANVRIGGLCFCDDLNWSGGGVQRAIAKLKPLGYRHLYYLDTGAMFQRLEPYGVIT